MLKLGLVFQSSKLMPLRPISQAGSVSVESSEKGQPKLRF